MRRLLTLLCVVVFVGAMTLEAAAGHHKPPPLKKMVKEPPFKCLKKPEKVGESYFGKGNGQGVSPCCSTESGKCRCLLKK